MADALTIQGMIDANVDVNTIEQAANEDMIVTARNGREFVSGPMASRIILEQGTIDAILFKTKADLDIGNALGSETPVSLVDDDFALVFKDDDVDLNGYYQKQAGVWEYLPYNIQRQALNQIEQAKQEAINLAATDAQNKANAAQTAAEEAAADYTDRLANQDLSNDNLLDFNDALGNTYADFNSDSGLELHGLEGTVQDNLKAAPKYAQASQNDLIQFLDDNGNPYLGVDSDSGLNLANLNASVQEHIHILQPHVHNFKTPKRMYFTSDVTAYTNQLVASGATLAPVPFGLLPSKYTVNDADVLAMTMPSPVGRLSLDTPYGNDDQVVHPFVFELAGTMRGYKFVMAINPYTAENQENPVIYASNNLVDFEILTGFDQPLDTPPDGGFLSDSCFTYDPTRGELVCFWRVTRRPADKIYTAYWCSRTKDLLNWTPKQLLLSEVDNDIEGLTSPSILFDPRTDTWHMWNISDRGYFTHRTTDDLYSDNWSAPTTINAIAQVAWHIEVKYVGDKFVMIINKSTAPENYYLGISSDGANWSLSTTPMLSETLEGLYKASFLPRFNSANDVYFDMFYTTNQHTNPDLKRRLFYTQTNAIATTGL